jgi:RNA polymerase sigma-70 factor, ECF subfamily
MRQIGNRAVLPDEEDDSMQAQTPDCGNAVADADATFSTGAWESVSGPSDWPDLVPVGGRSLQFEADLVAELPTLRARAAFLEKSHTAASDLVQDTVERALSNWFRFREGTDMRRWLLAIMHNLFVDRCRKRKRSRESCTTDLTATENQAGPGDLQNDDLARVPDAMALVGKLTARLQETVRLVLFDGRSYREAAEQLGVPAPTVGTRMARARAKLRAFALSSPELTD